MEVGRCHTRGIGGMRREPDFSCAMQSRGPFFPYDTGRCRTDYAFAPASWDQSDANQSADLIDIVPHRNLLSFRYLIDKLESTYVTDALQHCFFPINAASHPCSQLIFFRRPFVLPVSMPTEAALVKGDTTLPCLMADRVQNSQKVSCSVKLSDFFRVDQLVRD